MLTLNHFRAPSSTTDENQSGFVMVFGALAIFSVFGLLSAIVIDLGRIELTQTKLQTAADAAALAATNELDFKLYGWKVSKRSALLALRKSSILGHDGALNKKTTQPYLGVDLEAEEVIEDPYEPTSAYKNDTYQIGNLRVRITRGYYGRVFDALGTCQDYSFYSLEGSQENDRDCQNPANPSCVPNDYITKATEESVLDNNLPLIADCGGTEDPCSVVQLANSIKIELTLSAQKNAFTSFFPGNHQATSSIRAISTSAKNSFRRRAVPGCPEL